MDSKKSKKTPWAPCPQCHGQGQVLCGPSRKRLRLYQAEFETFKASHLNPPEADQKVPKEDPRAPRPPEPNLDICPRCGGSGLVVGEDPRSSDSAHFPHLAIIGGGIGGVALAVACKHRGIPFTLYERDESFDVRSQGYGLTLQQASSAMKGFGITSLDEGITSTRHVVHNQDGKIIGEWGLRKWNKTEIPETSKRKNVHIARQSLRSALLDQLSDSDSIKWNHKLIDFSQKEDGKIDLTFDVSGKKELAQADLIIGADGIRSRVRELLIGEKKTPLQYLDCMVILGICPLSALDDLTLESPLLDSATVFQTVNGNERIYLMPYDQDTIMWQLSFPLTESAAKYLSKKGPQAMKEEGLARLQEWHSPIPQILKTTQAADITGYPVYDREVLDPELLRDVGFVTLLGDAAHPMSPFKGQGANQALLDSLALARKISRECGAGSHWRETSLRKSILNDFEAEIIERSSSKVKDSRKAVRLLHSDIVLHEGDGPRGRGIE